MDQFSYIAQYYFGFSGIHTGHGAAAREVLAPLLTGRNRILSPTARAYIAQSLAQEGNLESAEREAKTALDGGARAVAFGALALVELRRGRPGEALVLTERASAFQRPQPLAFDRLVPAPDPRRGPSRLSVARTTHTLRSARRATASCGSRRRSTTESR